nr:Arm DNA-binding domain-containing protein [Pectobacterium polaris]
MYCYRIAQKQIKLTLGSYPAMGLAQACQAHADAAELVKKGIDPRYDRKMRSSKTSKCQYLLTCGKTSWHSEQRANPSALLPLPTMNLLPPS